MIYTGTFKDITDENQYVVNITTPLKSDEYVQTEKQITLASRPVIIKQKGGDTIFAPIRNLSAQIRIVLDENERPYYDMYTPTADGVTVEIYKVPENEAWVPIFEGFVEPNIYQQKFDYVDDLEIQCVDKIAFLKNKEYKAINGEDKIRTLTQILDHLFNDFGCWINVYNYVVGFQPVEALHEDTFSDLLINEVNMYDDDEMEEPWTCYKVLEEICKFTMTTLTWRYDESYNLMLPLFMPYHLYGLSNDKELTYNVFTRNVFTHTSSKRKWNVGCLEVNAETHKSKGGKITLDETYNKVRVAANTNVPANDDGEGESNEVIPDMFTANAVLTTKECRGLWKVKDGQYEEVDLFHKFYSDNAWETYRWGLNRVSPDLDYSDFTIVPAGNMYDFGYYLGGYNGPKTFNWMHDLYAVKAKTAIVNVEDDVKVQWEKYIALGLGLVGLEGCGQNDHQTPFADSTSLFQPEGKTLIDYYGSGSGGRNLCRIACRDAFDFHWNLPRMSYPLLKLPQAKSKIVYSPTGAAVDWILFNGTARLSCCTGHQNPRIGPAAVQNINIPDYQYKPWNMPVFYDSENWFCDGWDKDYKWFHNPKWRGGMPTICVSVKIGNKYWKQDYLGSDTVGEWSGLPEESYKWDSGSWVDYPTYFYIPIGKGDLCSETDYNVTNTVNYASGIEESGWAIPIKASDNISGQIEIVFYPPLFYTNKDHIGSSFKAMYWEPAALLLKDFKVGYYAQRPEGYYWEDDVDEDTDANDDADNEYAAVATEPWAANYVEEGDDIELDFNTQNPVKEHSYSSVLRITNEDGDTDYLTDTVDVDPATGQRIDIDPKAEAIQEVHIAQKYWKHFNSPKKIYEWTMDDFVQPDTRCFYNTLQDSSVFIVQSQDWDVRNNDNKIKITQL